MEADGIQKVFRRCVEHLTVIWIQLFGSSIHTGLLGILDGMGAMSRSRILPHPGSVSLPKRLPHPLYNGVMSSIVRILSRRGDGEITEGTGFVAGKRGYVVTAGHVVVQENQGSIQEDASKPTRVYITTAGGKNYEARIIAVDQNANVAILYVVSGDFDAMPLHIHNNYTAAVGDPITIIGNVSGLDSHSVSEGIVRNPKWKDPLVENLLTNILTTVPTTNGFSGAPILDRDGSVLGIHTSFIYPTDRAKQLKVVAADADDTAVLGRCGDKGHGQEFSTMLGGGLVAPLLTHVLDRVLHSGDCPTGTSTYVILYKQFLSGYHIIPNGLANRMCSPDYENILQPDNGYIIGKHIGSSSGLITGLETGDIVTHVDRKHVGLGVSDESLWDNLWLRDSVKLTIKRDNVTIDLDVSSVENVRTQAF